MKKSLFLLIAICITEIGSAQLYTLKAHITGFPNGTKFYLRDVEVDSDIIALLYKMTRLF